MSLPVSLTPMVGRDEEVEQILAMLDSDGTRLLTLTGPGGIGKTRLALEIARRLEGEFAHGAHFVPLASVRDPDLVPAATAHALGFVEYGDQPAREMLVSRLRDQHLLLVLDNLEHLVETASLWLAELLAQCPRVKALVTSRIALQVSGEHRFIVPALPLPEQIDAPLLERASASAAVRLFEQRASEVRPDFVLTDGNAGVVSEICRAVDGLPLAIELAVARMNVLSLPAILARLTHRLTFLETGRRDTPARHRTMRAAIGWSHDLLSPDDQRLFRRLSVFVGGFSMEAAEAICESDVDRDSQNRLVDGVGTLIDHSLVGQRAGGLDEYRFEMLETVREFGLAQLAAFGELTAARDAHADYYLRLAREAEPAMRTSAQVAWLDRLEQEHDNIRVALAWLTERERIQEAMDLAGSIWFFRWIRGYYTEGRDQLDTLLAHPLGAEPTIERARALNAAGITMLSQGDTQRSLEVHEEALEIARALNDEILAGFVLMCTAATHMTMDDTERAVNAATESLELARKHNDTWGEASASNILGAVAIFRGDILRGKAHIDTSISLCRAIGDRFGTLLGLGNLGLCALQSSDFDTARQYVSEGVDLMYELGDKRDLPNGLMGLATIARHDGDVAAARSFLDEALTVARETGDKYLVAYALLSMGQLACAEHEHERSVRLLRESIMTFMQMGVQSGVIECLDVFADIAIAMNDAGRAASLIGSSDAFLDQLGHFRQEASPGEHQARVDAIVGALGEPGYRQAWAAGRERSLDDVIAEVAAFEVSSAPGGAVPATPVSGPGADLSPRELEVLRLMADGLSNQEIADALFLSRRTATSHASNVLGKLGLNSRTAAVAYAIRSGLA